MKLQLIVDALATWRIANMLVNEDGPDRVFQKLRQWSGIVYVGNEVVYVDPRSPLDCVWCASVWVGLALRVVPVQLRWALALSALAIAYHEQVIKAEWAKNGAVINNYSTVA